MKKGERYIVTTHWGTFSLDEGSYRDYLAGELWITWQPGQPRKKKLTLGESIPKNVTERAIALREMAGKEGIVFVFRQLGVSREPVLYNARLEEVSIDEMSLSVRSSNGLKRAGIHTFGKLHRLLETEAGVLSIRNLGIKSAREIRTAYFEESYARLLPYEKAQYWQEVVDRLSAAC